MARDERDQQGMKKNAATEKGKDMASWKPGSDAASAKDVKAEGDFGVPAGSGPSRQREYVSENTKMSDPGAAKPRSGEDPDGVRTSGAGWTAEADGSGSEGDIDTDVLGVGTGGTGVAATGPDDTPGPDDSDGTSSEMASGRPAAGRNQTGVGRVGGNKRVKGTTFSRSEGDPSTYTDAQGADAATNPAAQGDDSFAGEVSTGEASGEDNALSPSSDSQGLQQEDD
ncbi:MAG TPA: hypothetical protein VFB66_15395 [Tepidisphaeraceae bacterium]|nr:hypothetical protein [Tepidisphaeraceae bacterium]